jgi:hypothetical protein
VVVFTIGAWLLLEAVRTEPLEEEQRCVGERQKTKVILVMQGRAKRRLPECADVWSE